MENSFLVAVAPHEIGIGIENGIVHHLGLVHLLIDHLSLVQLLVVHLDLFSSLSGFTRGLFSCANEEAPEKLIGQENWAED